jgi:hypothetical protein
MPICKTEIPGEGVKKPTAWGGWGWQRAGQWASGVL